MDMSGYLKQKWQDDHAEEYANGLKAKNNYTGLIDALAGHPFERVRRAALKTIHSLDFTTLDGPTIDLIEESIRNFLSRNSKLFSVEFVDAAGILAKIGRPEGIGYLISFLEKDEPQKMHNMDVDRAFDSCCGAVGEPGVDLILAHLLEHGYCPIEIRIACGLGSIGGERAHDALVLALKHHCEIYQVFGFRSCQIIDAYVSNIKRIGVRPSDLDTLKVSLEAVKKAEAKNAKEMANTHGPLIGKSPYPVLMDLIQELIKKIELEAN
jgi:hypothetical protein